MIDSSQSCVLLLKVVSITLSRGLSVVLFILLLPPTDWTNWISTLALVIFMALPFVVTTKLLYIVRNVTRGGRVHRLSESVFWFGKPRLLLPVINFMLFTISTVYATAVSLNVLFLLSFFIHNFAAGMYCSV